MTERVQMRVREWKSVGIEHRDVTVVEVFFRAMLLFFFEKKLLSDEEIYGFNQEVVLYIYIYIYIYIKILKFYS